MSIRMRNDLSISLPLKRDQFFLIIFIGNAALGQ